MNKNTRKNKRKFTKVQNNLVKTVYYISENDNLKNNHIFKFKLIFNLLITKYKLSSASISENKKQINFNNITQISKKSIEKYFQ
jgi:response regulator RpfG family c-di-GMP phosphodiesterase